MAGFADTDTLIDTVLEKYMGVSASDSNATAKRARILQNAQEALDEIWIFADWLFSYKTGTVSFTAASDSGDLPADFMEFGEVGGIMNNDTDTQFGEVRPIDAYFGVIRGLAGEEEEVVSPYGLNTSTGRRTLRLRGNASANTTITILYRFTAPTLVDTTSTTSNLWQLPSSYHSTVLLPKLLKKLDIAHGDINRTEEDYKFNLQQMLRRERARKTVPQRLPSFNDEMW
jgi:hypothetical protein